MYVVDKVVRGERVATVKHAYLPALKTFAVYVFVDGERAKCVLVGRRSLHECIAKACRTAVELAYPSIF